MSVAFRCQSAYGRVFAQDLRRDAVALLGAAGLSACELSLSLVSDDAIRALNRDFRGNDAPTDVLSFSQVEERDKTPPDPLAVLNRRGMLLGDVVISVDTALRQASEIGLPPAERLRTLLIHGFLHLLGYDHERSPVEARRMFARERDLAASLSRTRSAGTKAQDGKMSSASARRRKAR